MAEQNIRELERKAATGDREAAASLYYLQGQISDGRYHTVEFPLPEADVSVSANPVGDGYFWVE